jgi:ankyrin repeat protein
LPAASILHINICVVNQLPTFIPAFTRSPAAVAPNLVAAAWMGQPLVFARLLAAVPRNSTIPPEVKDAYLYACRQGNVQIMAMLLGCDPTPFNDPIAATSAPILPMEIKFDRKSAYIDHDGVQTISDKGGDNGAILATRYGHITVLRMLLAHGGATINETVSKDGARSLLVVASSRGDPTVVKFLLASGADLNARTKHKVSSPHRCTDPFPHICSFAYLFLFKSRYRIPH